MISLDILKRLYLKLLRRIVLLSLYCVLLFTEAYERFRSGLMTLLSLINLCISVVWFSLIVDLAKVFPKSSPLSAWILLLPELHNMFSYCSLCLASTFTSFFYSLSIHFSWKLMKMKARVNLGVDFPRRAWELLIKRGSTTFEALVSDLLGNSKKSS